jgi:hypothetical protein
VADQHDQHLARAHRLLDGIDEVDAGIEGIDVHEHPARKAAAQPVEQPSRVARAVFTAIVDEDVLTHDCLQPATRNFSSRSC